MIKTIYIVLFFATFGLLAQNQIADENINTLIEKYSSDLTIKCDIDIKIDVEGMVIPDKQIYVEFEEGSKPIVKGKGLALLPKKGIVGHFKELFSTPLQPIFLSKKGNNLVYKLVSLEQKSDWITADIEFDENSFLIYKATINTRKQGTFYSEHFYKDNIFPSKSIITFNIKKFNIPLKFVGRSDNTTKTQLKDEEVLGKITLMYTYL